MYRIPELPSVKILPDPIARLLDGSSMSVHVEFLNRRVILIRYLYLLLQKVIEENRERKHLEDQEQCYWMQWCKKMKRLRLTMQSWKKKCMTEKLGVTEKGPAFGQKTPDRICIWYGVVNWGSVSCNSLLLPPSDRCSKNNKNLKTTFGMLHQLSEHCSDKSQDTHWYHWLTFT